MGTETAYGVFISLMADPHEQALIARIRSGDLPAFEELLRPYGQRVYQTVLRITRNPADAADVYQTAILAAFEKLDDFRGDAAFGSWLFQIAVNCALMSRRATKRDQAMADVDIPRFNWMGGYGQPVRNWARSAEDCAYRVELRAALAGALGALPDIDRAIVWLKDVEGLSHADVAAATGLTVLAIRSRLHRARLRLRDRLAAQFGAQQ
ncbi:MAG: RNA polymerase sigma factor [Candidatus Binatia bacterium]